MFVLPGYCDDPEKDEQKKVDVRETCFLSDGYTVAVLHGVSKLSNVNRANNTFTQVNVQQSKKKKLQLYFSIRT